MRPRTLDEFVGQEHILAPGKLLRRAIEADRLPSLIISGPPGSGKTTLAYVVAEITHSEFIRLSGVESNVAEMRKVVAAAANRLRTSGRKTIVFIDEIHHFNKAQQDILLPDVESGNLRLIGATTYNPYFYVNSALVSRSLVFRLEPLTVEQLEILIDRALADFERGLGKYNVKMDADARRHLATGNLKSRWKTTYLPRPATAATTICSFISPSGSLRRVFKPRRSFMIKKVTRTMTQSARSLKACAPRMKKARSIG